MEEILHLLIGSLSHHLQGFAPFPGGFLAISEPSAVFFGQIPQHYRGHS